MATTPTFQDYKHASKLFVEDHFNFVPKYSFLYHVYFDVNQSNLKTDPQNPNGDRELGLMVKAVGLPKFTIDTKVFNSYNRPNIVQTKIKYDPVQFTFHDDSADLVRNFWFDYYNYYYRDSDHDEALYHQQHKYQDKIPTSGWGYTTRSSNSEPYLQSIRIYSLHQRRFSEYVLINPLIKSFKHGEHKAGENDLLGHDMTVEYESIIYAYGTIGPSTVPGFVDLHYDPTPSPLPPQPSAISFGEAFRAARNAQIAKDRTNPGGGLFTWMGNMYNTIHKDKETAERAAIAAAAARNSPVYIPSQKVSNFNLGINGTSTTTTSTGTSTTTTRTGTRSGMDYAKNLKPGQSMKFTYTDEGGYVPVADEVTQQSIAVTGAPQSATRVLAPNGATIPAKSGTTGNGGGQQRAGKIHYPGNWHDTRLPPPTGYEK